MTDPFSIGAGAVGIISLAIQVTQSLVKIYDSYKDRDSDLKGVDKRLTALTTSLEALENIVKDPNYVEEHGDLCRSVQSSIEDCSDYVQELVEECQKFEQNPNTGAVSKIKVTGRRLAYPFRQSTIQKLDENISGIRSNVAFALGVLQAQTSQALKDDISGVKSLLESVELNRLEFKLREWLMAPDATIDHNAACSKAQDGTGHWLTMSHSFTRWMTTDNSLIWLRGFAGCGKSVLCSTAIQLVHRHQRGTGDVAIAFFYFTFNDKSKQDSLAMMRAIVGQLACQTADHHYLKELYESQNSAQPMHTKLSDCLQYLIPKFRQVYIFLDALDESPRGESREEVLNMIKALNDWGLASLHLLCTSRDEPDIADWLNDLKPEVVEMRNQGISSDIAAFVAEKLKSDRRLQSLTSASRSKIERRLNEGAEGW